MSSSGVNREKFLISLEEINQATQNFNDKTRIAYGESGCVHRGQLSEQWQNCTAAIRCVHGHRFHYELELMPRLQHANIIPFIGYSDENGWKIIVTEYATNGTLADYVKDRGKRGGLTWAQRLKICLGVARGINYLHSGLGKDDILIKRNISSSNILLDNDLEAKICGFSSSILVPRNQPQVYKAGFRGTKGYTDPIYLETGMVMTKTDTYSFGVLLFEMLSGMLAYETKSIGDDDKRLRLIQWVHRYYDVGLEGLIDYDIRDEMDRPSLRVIKDIAYKCISFNINDRPTFDIIIKTIEEALDVHNRGGAAIVSIGGHKHPNPQNFKIPFKEIKKATGDFSCEAKLRSVYRGQLSEGWQNRTAAIKRSFDSENQYYRNREVLRNEVKLMSRLQHENIVPFIGYCDENDRVIIATEYAINGSLDDYLHDPEKRQGLTWAHRLKICLGVAKGLKYLHSGLEDYDRVIHRDPNSRNILLDDKLEPKICDFGLSVLLPRNQLQVYKPIEGDKAYPNAYTDLVYKESGFLNTEADVYTFGLLMFEIMCGMLVYERRSFGDVDQLPLKILIRQYSDDDNRAEIIVDPLLRDQVDSQSLHEFIDLAYECISFNLRDRPSMNSIIKRIQKLLDFQIHGAASTVTITSHQNRKLEDFHIPLDEIKKAKEDFSLNSQAVDGGFGLVHFGQLSERWQNRKVAIKHLKHSDFDEFIHELKLIFKFQHENIIPFVGYYKEENEMIIVTEYATNGSLDDYLENEEKRTRLTYRQRLNICLGAARGLNYLHSGRGEGNRVIHRDVKSANILLDDKLEAKICDFGLSKLDLTNQTHTGIYTKYAGTDTYIDPVYRESGKLRAKSDVYSFGVVMFEMLSGMPAYHLKQYRDGKPQLLISLARRYYNAGRLDLLIDPSLRDQPCDSRSLLIFQEIAYECINMNHKQRPTMETVIDRLEEALGYQIMMESQAKVTES